MSACFTAFFPSASFTLCQFLSLPFCLSVRLSVCLSGAACLPRPSRLFSVIWVHYGTQVEKTKSFPDPSALNI